MKTIKMVLYGEPGVGKSVFASKAPNPFFITTDGNYEWLLDFGAKEEAHRQVYSWEEAKKVFASPELQNYDTIVVDLTEDLFKWCEYEFCKKNKLEHVSDIGFAKGYDITRNEFFIEISKLLAMDKNIILIMHGISSVVKDRRGVEHTKHTPSSRIPDKVLDMIEGRVRYFLRCYLKAEENSDGTLTKKRYLSLVPKENEFGIIRGVDENKIPQDIPLDFDTFASVIGLENEVKETKSRKRRETKAKVEEVVKEATEEAKKVEEDVAFVNPKEKEEFAEATPVVEQPKVEVKPELKPEVKVQPELKAETKPAEQPKTESKEDKLAALKAKLAAIKAQQNK